MNRHHVSMLAAPPAAAAPAPRTLVVIEDDDDIRALIETIFVRAGMVVHTAGTAAEGIALVSGLAPDLVTIDVHLPDGDGLDVAASLHEGDATRDLPILMISAGAYASEAADVLDAGTEAFLSKPFRPRELRAKVAALLAASACALPLAVGARRSDRLLVAAL